MMMVWFSDYAFAGIGIGVIIVIMIIMALAAYANERRINGRNITVIHIVDSDEPPVPIALIKRTPINNPPRQHPLNAPHHRHHPHHQLINVDTNSHHHPRRAPSAARHGDVAPSNDDDDDVVENKDDEEAGDRFSVADEESLEDFDGVVSDDAVLVQDLR